MLLLPLHARCAHGGSALASENWLLLILAAWDLLVTSVRAALLLLMSSEVCMRQCLGASQSSCQSGKYAHLVLQALGARVALPLQRLIAFTLTNQLLMQLAILLAEAASILAHNLKLCSSARRT
jgi:hypothetical protein